MSNKAYDKVTEKILEALSQGVKPWQYPWHKKTTPLANGVTLKAYHGINTVMVLCDQMMCMRKSTYYMTYKQAASIGGNVKKGAKGIPIVFYKSLEVQDENSEDELKRIPFASYSTVFSLDDIENVDHKLWEAPLIEKTDIQMHDQSEKIMAQTNAKIEFGGDHACFIPSKDVINIPEREKFTSQSGYYSTVFHELGHWTGHKDRLNRLKEFSDKKTYAFEELVAELSAAFVCGQVGFEYTEQHASYIDNWMKAMREDSKVIFKAAAAAQKATDYILKTQISVEKAA